MIHPTAKDSGYSHQTYYKILGVTVIVLTYLLGFVSLFSFGFLPEGSFWHIMAYFILCVNIVLSGAFVTYLWAEVWDNE